jgi:hypothetical protein
MNWGSLKLTIGRKVNDPTALKNSESILDNANAALRLIASIHTGLASVSDYVGDGETTQFPLPSNAVEGKVRGVYDVDNDVWLTKIDFFPGEALDEGFYLWPNTYINFSPAIPDTETLRVHYIAYYPEIESDDDIIQTPAWAYEAIALYAAGRTLEDNSSQFSVLGQTRTRVDAGNPEDQPVLRLAERYIRQFYDLLNQHQAQATDFL